ncbi:MAG: hypothetical protein H6822_36385 [Planctomycetaceae bacterium]|nr:hypothetical protein [Planctomycetales bacterium]MCB9927667.1 hypothetical protein [Planctomycetaceae bacterium]
MFLVPNGRTIVTERIAFLTFRTTNEFPVGAVWLPRKNVLQNGGQLRELAKTRVLHAVYVGRYAA